MTAEAIGQLETAARGRVPADALADFSGVYHTAGTGETTWCGFAAEAVRLRREKEPETRFAEIEAITTAEYPTPARRPANSRMNCERLVERFGWTMMDWRDSLGKVLAEI
jgi:dTDP-4-dehydrorhamnose reductase